MIGTSFSVWDANGDKFVIFAVSGSRDLENRIFGSRGASGIAEQLKNVKRIRLALVSASGTPMVTNLSFLQFRALGTSKIGFLSEK